MSVAVVFPGQGSQFVGMGKDFYENFQVVREFFEKADNELGYSLSQIILEGPEDELKLTQNAQPALVLISVAIWSLIEKEVSPSFFAGHSLGEYSAIYAAGGLSFEETVKAVHNRGLFMQNAVPVGVGAMGAVLGLDENIIIEVCKNISRDGFIVEPANFNCVGQVVIAGHKEAVEKASEELKNAGAKRVVPLPVSAPFHCSLMIKAKVDMAEYFQGVTFNDLKVPVVNNIDAEIEEKAEDVKNALIRQVAGAVKWQQSIEKMVSMGVTTFIEVGAGSVLTGLIKKINREVATINISTVTDLDKIKEIGNNK